MELRVGIDRETHEKLNDLQFIYSHATRRETLRLARHCYEWYVGIVARKWIFASMSPREKGYVMFTRHYRGHGLFASAEHWITGDIAVTEKVEILGLLRRSGAADLSAMTTEAVWVLWDMTQAIAMGRDIYGVSQLTREYEIFNRPEFENIRRQDEE